jgi:hypothetical protein
MCKQTSVVIGDIAQMLAEGKRNEGGEPPLVEDVNLELNSTTTQLNYTTTQCRVASMESPDSQGHHHENTLDNPHTHLQCCAVVLL